jgi:hypothetical protein
MKHGRNAEAMAVISAMEDKPPSDPEVRRTYYGIREAVAVETSSRGTLRELTTGGRSQNFRRATIAVVLMMMQQLTGINLVTLWVFWYNVLWRAKYALLRSVTLYVIEAHEPRR